MITEVPYWGVYSLGSPEEQEGICDNTSLNRCPWISEKSHPLFGELQKCKSKNECQLRDLHGLIPYQDDSECPISPTSSLYVNYSCTISSEEQIEKRKTALLASSASIFVILLVFGFTRSAKHYVRIEKTTWDIMTRTVSDYTLEIPISEAQLKTFYEQLTDDE